MRSPRGSCDTVDVILPAGLCVRYEEAAREQAQQGVSPDKQDRPPGVLPERRRRRECHAIREPVASLDRVLTRMV